EQCLGPAAASPPVSLLVAQIHQYVRLLVPYWRRASAPSVHLVILRRALSSCAGDALVPVGQRLRFTYELNGTTGASPRDVRGASWRSDSAVTPLPILSPLR